MKKKITAKPFSRDFDEQMDAACELYESKLRFECSGSQLLKHYEKLLRPYEELLACREPLDPSSKQLDHVIVRVRETLRAQTTKYQYLFGNIT